MSRILVLEKQPRWQPELRRQLAEVSIRIQSRSSAAEVQAELAAERRFPSPVVIVADLSAGARGILALAAAVRQRPDVRLVVLSHPELQPLEPVLRELGADSFLLLPVPGDTVADVCLRLAGLKAARA